MLYKAGMGSNASQDFEDGFPIAGDLGEPGVRPVAKQCKSPDFAPCQLLADSRNRISDRASACRPPFGNELRSEAMGQFEKGRIDGPLSRYQEGQLLTGRGLQLVNPDFRFGVSQG